MKKYVVFIDMDGPLADFDGSIAVDMHDPPEMFVPGFYRNLPVVPGAYKAMAQLFAMPHLDLYIGSKPTTGNLHSTIEKYQWIACNFPRMLKKIFLVCDKSLLRGDVLVDDDKERWAGTFKGMFLHFDNLHPEESWEFIVKELSELQQKQAEEKT